MKTENTDTEINSDATDGRMKRLVRWFDEISMWLCFQIGFWHMIPSVCKKYNVVYNCVKNDRGMWEVRVGDSVVMDYSRKQAIIKANWNSMHPSND